MKPEKAGEGKPIRNLELQLLVADIEETFDNKSFEHENHIQRLAPGRAFAIRVAQGIGQNGTK